MTSVALAEIVIEASDPIAVAMFWRDALGGHRRAGGDAIVVSGAFPDLRVVPESRPEAAKNRVHFDLYVGALEPLIDLGATVLTEYRPERATATTPSLSRPGGLRSSARGSALGLTAGPGTCMSVRGGRN